MITPEGYNRHEIEPRFRLMASELRRGIPPDLIGETRKGNGFSDAAYYLKRHAMSWATTAPRESGLTRSERNILAAIVWRFDLGKGYALLTYEDLADAATNLERRKSEPRAEPLGRRTVARAVSKLAHLGLVQFKSGRGGIQNRRNLANQYHPNFWIFIDPFSGRFVVPEYGLPMYEWRTVAGYFRARLETGENPGNGTTLPNESAPFHDNDENGTTLLNGNPQETAEAKGHLALSNGNGGSSSADTPSADAAGEPSSPPSDEKKIKGKCAYDGYEREGDWVPKVHESTGPKVVMRYMVHTLAEWDAILAPDMPDRRFAQNYVNDLLTEEAVEMVEGAMRKATANGTTDAFDHEPLEEFLEAGGLAISTTNKPDYYGRHQFIVDRSEIESEDRRTWGAGDRMMIWLG